MTNQVFSGLFHALLPMFAFMNDWLSCETRAVEDAVALFHRLAIEKVRVVGGVLVLPDIPGFHRNTFIFDNGHRPAHHGAIVRHVFVDVIVHYEATGIVHLNDRVETLAGTDRHRVYIVRLGKRITILGDDQHVVPVQMHLLQLIPRADKTETHDITLLYAYRLVHR